MIIELETPLIGIDRISDGIGPVGYVCEGIMIDWCYYCGEYQKDSVYEAIYCNRRHNIQQSTVLIGWLYEQLKGLVLLQLDGAKSVSIRQGSDLGGDISYVLCMHMLKQRGLNSTKQF